MVPGTSSRTHALAARRRPTACAPACRLRAAVGALGAVVARHELPSEAVLADLPEPPPDRPPRAVAGRPAARAAGPDGHRPLAWVDGHGTWVQWLSG